MINEIFRNIKRSSEICQLHFVANSVSEILHCVEIISQIYPSEHEESVLAVKVRSGEDRRSQTGSKSREGIVRAYNLHHLVITHFGALKEQRVYQGQRTDVSERPASGETGAARQQRPQTPRDAHALRGLGATL